MNVLSLFDGISTGQLALKQLDIDVDKYYASEINSHALQITKYNFPNTIQLGDVNNWQEWNIDWDKIDLLIGGSPCVNLSDSGNGKGLEGSQSSLFFKYIDIRNYIQSINPNVKFLLENVNMKKIWLDRMNEYVGFEPIHINSKDFSSQLRDRLYWCNWNVSLDYAPSELTLMDIVEEVEDDKYDLSLKQFNNFMKSYPRWRCNELNEKSFALLSSYHKHTPHCPYLRKASSESGYRRLTPLECERLQTLPDNYTKYGIKKDKVVKMSNYARYETIGNGWTLEVIKFIMKELKNG